MTMKERKEVLQYMKELIRVTKEQYPEFMKENRLAWIDAILAIYKEVSGLHDKKYNESKIKHQMNDVLRNRYQWDGPPEYWGGWESNLSLDDFNYLYDKMYREIIDIHTYGDDYLYVTYQKFIRPDEKWGAYMRHYKCTGRCPFSKKMSWNQLSRFGNSYGITGEYEFHLLLIFHMRGNVESKINEINNYDVNRYSTHLILWSKRAVL